MSGFIRQESKLIYAPKICHSWQVFGASFVRTFSIFCHKEAPETEKTEFVLDNVNNC